MKIMVDDGTFYPEHNFYRFSHEAQSPSAATHQTPLPEHADTALND